MTEDDTFLRLKRWPFKQAFVECTWIVEEEAEFTKKTGWDYPTLEREQVRFIYD